MLFFLHGILAKSLQPCPTLCDPIDGSMPGSSVHVFSRQEYWSGLSFYPPGDLPDPGIDSASLMSPASGGRSFTTTDIWEAVLKLQWLRKGKIRFCGGVKWPPSGQSH